MGAGARTANTRAQHAGNPVRSAGAAPGRKQLRLGDEAYLWLLVALEVLAMAWLRQAFGRRHGG